MDRVTAPDSQYHRWVHIIKYGPNDDIGSTGPFTLLQRAKNPKTQVKRLETIVPPGDFIRNDEATLELARLLAHSEKNLEEAIDLYRVLLAHDPLNATSLLEISRIFIRRKEYEKALFHLKVALQAHPTNPHILVEVAHAELALGHPKQSFDYLLKARGFTGDLETILMAEANVFMAVGSFYKAETIYQRAWAAQPESLELALKLAWVFVSAERYEEAEGLYKKLLLRHPDHPEIWEALVTLKVLEKDFSTALCWADILLHLVPEKPSYLQLQANVLFKSENYLEALQAFEVLSLYPTFRTEALIGQGRVYAKWGESAKAEENFHKAYENDPTSIPARFYRTGKDVGKEWFREQIMAQTRRPADLMEWANIYADNGMAGIVEFYERALQLDSEYFPAQNGLAEALSAHYRYDEALGIYLSLLDTFPEDSKLMIAVARVLSWGKHYRRSMRWYDKVIALNPADPLPVREKARVAGWGKFFAESMEIYALLLRPTVDRVLWEALQGRFCHESPISRLMTRLVQSASNGSIYTGYETFATDSMRRLSDLNCEERKTLEEILLTYFPLYRIQKATLLESQAKALDWQYYYLHALPVYRELADFVPGNAEGLYGYAQDFCNLGLCRYSRRLYEHMLSLDPNNPLAKMALERNEQRLRLLLQGNYSYWSERGTGQFSNSQIARQQWDELVEISPACDWHIRFLQSEWLEYPFFKDKYYLAQGQAIQVDYLFNRYVKGEAGAGYKSYFHRFPTRFTFSGSLWFNVEDYVKLGMGIERRNEIYNYFNLKQATQADVYWATLRAASHAWNVETTYRHLHYNDHNELDHFNLVISYAFTEDPNVFKVIMATSYRNTAHLTRLIISPKGKLLTIIYPYWTPQDYYSGSVTFEFRYNYAWFTSCEAAQRYVDIKITGEDDNVHNPSIQIAVNWKHEFRHHWGFEITGLYHRSKLWNADGIWAQVYYRF